MRRLHLLPLLALAPAALAQLPPPPVPFENPITEEKRILGKLLFWEEQLSSDDTMACGTCHQPSAGGSDPRFERHPGGDGNFGNLNDKFGSPGVRDSDASDNYHENPFFGFDPQVTDRSSISVIGAAYAPELFWDGRASTTFVDPQTGTVAIVVGGALESQIVGPPVSDAEMAHAERDWDMICDKLTEVRPMALATNLPPDMQTAVSGGVSYPDLFEDAFGDGEITARRVAFAIATYERTLIADDTPWDRSMQGLPGGMTPQQNAGWIAFQNPVAACSQCHTPPFFTDHSFRNIGLRPNFEDRGRQDVTGNTADRGKFKVPTLRNIGLKETFFHNGGILDGPMNNIVNVLEFYLPVNGHIHNLNNIDPLVPGINYPPPVLNDLAAFLGGALTDPRVAAEMFPFDRPTLASEHLDDYISQIPGTGTLGSNGQVPELILGSPPSMGGRGFRTGVRNALGGARAYVSLTTHAPGQGPLFGLRQVFPVQLEAGGYGTWHWDIPMAPGLIGTSMYAQWYVVDPTSPSGRFAKSDAMEIIIQ